MAEKPETGSKNNTDRAEQTPDETAESASTFAGHAESENDNLASQLAEANDRCLRLQAELENFRKRTRRDMEDERRYASLPLVRDLLQVVDNLGRAAEAAEKTRDIDGLLEGVKMVAHQLETLLANHGCSRIEAVGQPFDPNFHEAIAQQTSDEHEPQMVLAEAQPGFKLHDRVVRPSQVIVSKSS